MDIHEINVYIDSANLLMLS